MRNETISHLKQNADHERREQAIALLKLLSLGEKSREAGMTMSADEFMAKVRDRHDNMH